MAISYNKLFKLLKKRGLTTYKIRKYNIIGQATYQRMRTGSGNIDTGTIDKLCKALNCQPGDIMEYVPDDDKKTL